MANVAYNMQRVYNAIKTNVYSLICPDSDILGFLPRGWCICERRPTVFLECCAGRTVCFFLSLHLPLSLSFILNFTFRTTLLKWKSRTAMSTSVSRFFPISLCIDPNFVSFSHPWLTAVYHVVESDIFHSNYVSLFFFSLAVQGQKHLDSFFMYTSLIQTYTSCQPFYHQVLEWGVFVWESMCIFVTSSPLPHKHWHLNKIHFYIILLCLSE